MRWPYPWDKNTNPLAIPSGFLRNAVQIQAPPSTQDSDGGPTDEWRRLWSGLVGIMTIGSYEVYQANKITGQVTHRVSLWWPGSQGIAPGCRVVFGARIFLVQALDNVQERNLVLHLMCLELGGAQ